jgi:hypothetical protein
MPVTKNDRARPAEPVAGHGEGNTLSLGVLQLSQTAESVASRTRFIRLPSVAATCPPRGIAHRRRRCWGTPLPRAHTPLAKRPELSSIRTIRKPTSTTSERHAAAHTMPTGRHEPLDYFLRSRPTRCSSVLPTLISPSSGTRHAPRTVPAVVADCALGRPCRRRRARTGRGRCSSSLSQTLQALLGECSRSAPARPAGLPEWRGRPSRAFSEREPGGMPLPTGKHPGWGGEHERRCT